MERRGLDRGVAAAVGAAIAGAMLVAGVDVAGCGGRSGLRVGEGEPTPDAAGGGGAGVGPGVGGFAGEGGQGGSGGPGAGARGGEGGRPPVAICDDAPPTACPSSAPWAVRLGTTSSQETVRAVAALPDCSVVAAGELDVGLFVANYDAAGAEQYTTSFGDGAGERARDIVVDERGNSFFLGMHTGELALGGNTFNTRFFGWDWVVASFGVDGGHRWSQAYGGEGLQETHSIAVADNGRLVVAGHFIDVASIGGEEHAAAGDWDVLLAKLEPDGEVQWSRSFGDHRIQAVPNISVRADRDIWWGGWFRGELDLGIATLSAPTADGDDGYLVRLTANGDPAFARQLAGPGNQRVNDVVTACDDGAFISGDFTGTLDAPPLSLPLVGARDGFVVRLDAEGAPLWAAQLSGSGASVQLAATATRADGASVTVGSFTGTLVVGGTSYPSAGGSDIVVWTLDPNGGNATVRTYGAASNDMAMGATFLPDGSIVLGGRFEGTLAIEGVTITSAGGADAFIAHIPPAGG